MNTQIKNKAFLPVDIPEYQAFKAIGFQFQNLKLENNVVRGKLVCLCGKTEIFKQKLDKPLKEQGKEFLDFTIKLFLFDDKHLLEDGYTYEQIAEIRRKYNQGLNQ